MDKVLPARLTGVPPLRGVTITESWFQQYPSLQTP
jgi:hypothetical protein